MTTADRTQPSQLGGTIGGRLARVVAEASALSRAKTAPHIGRVTNQVISDFFAMVDKEAQAANGPILGQLAEHPATPAEIRPLLRAAAHPTGQWQAFLAQSAAGSAMSVGLGALLNNFMSDPIQELIRLNPNSLLDAGTIASAAARGIDWTRNPVDEAERSGLSRDRIRAMIELNRARPAAGEIISMLNRGIVNRGQAERMLRLLGYSGDDTDRILGLRRQLLSAQQLAEAVNRGEMEPAQGRRRAAEVGVDGDDFDMLTTIIDFPPGVDRLQEALRRGFINQSRFRRGIAQSTLRVEWADVMEKLQFQRMSPVAAADAVNQNFMDEDTGRRIAHEHGLDPDDFSIILQTAGRPPGVRLMQEAWNRGLISERQFRQGFLESNIKNKWLELLVDTRFRVMPREQINLTYRFGGFGKREAIKRYKWFGFSREDAEAMLVAEDRRKVGPERDLTLATVLDLYEGSAISRAMAVDFLSGMGFDRTSTDLMLSLRDVRREQRFQNLAISRVRSQYTRFEIDQRAAENALDRLGTRAEQRTELIDTWNIEREIARPTLTTSQIQQAVRKGLLSPGAGFARLQQQGYTETDATILINLVAPSE